jgi:hypothetical protein
VIDDTIDMIRKVSNNVSEVGAKGVVHGGVDGAQHDQQGGIGNEWVGASFSDVVFRWPHKAHSLSWSVLGHRKLLSISG